MEGKAEREGVLTARRTCIVVRSGFLMSDWDETVTQPRHRYVRQKY